MKAWAQHGQQVQVEVEEKEMVQLEVEVAVEAKELQEASKLE